MQPVYVREFTEETGPAVPVPSSPLQVFHLFFTPAILEYIVTETNRYARLEMGEERYRKWDIITNEDLIAYFGIMIVMGMVRLPALADYWKRDPLFQCTIVSESMARDRFFEIHRFLHFVDISTTPLPTDDNYDRLNRIRKILTLIEERFVALYHPHCQCAVDEAMVPYKGRSSLKQYMPKKPVKRGLKVWVRADSVTGYISRYQVYTGKEKSSEKGLGSRVVKELTADLHHRNHHVYCDNFFSSFQLFSDLFSDGIYACGTIKSNRKEFPPTLSPVLKKGLPNRGDCITVQSIKLPNLTVSVWQDTRPVTVTATNCQSVPLDSVQRKLRTGEHEEYPCPEAITQYNKYMGGVDHNDQLRQYYHVRLKCRKYYKYIFWFLFDVTVSNAFIISKTNPEMAAVTRSVKAFRTHLAKEMLSGYCSRKRKGRKPSIPRKPFSTEHFPVKGDGKQHPCDHCKLSKIRRDTTWYCRECSIYLCHRGDPETDCFLLYHKRYCQGQ